MNATVVAATIPATVTTLAIIGTGIGVAVTVRQKDREGRRIEFWKRLTWALDKTAADDSYNQLIGWRVVQGLLASGLATDTEEDIVRALALVEAKDDTED